MSDVDRYIPDGTAAASVAMPMTEVPLIAEVLRAALPGILAAHRADVLEEAIAAVRQTPDEIPALVLRDLKCGIPADEAVAE